MEWSCEVCTYFNAPLALACDMCGSPNPKPPQSSGSHAVAAAAHAPAVADVWSCPSCTYINPPIVMVCEICQARNPNPPAAAAVATVKPEAAVASRVAEYFHERGVPERRTIADVLRQHGGVWSLVGDELLTPLVNIAAAAADSHLRCTALHVVAAYLRHCPAPVLRSLQRDAFNLPFVLSGACLCVVLCCVVLCCVVLCCVVLCCVVLCCVVLCCVVLCCVVLCLLIANVLC
jgi:hypothetical protein